MTGLGRIARLLAFTDWQSWLMQRSTRPGRRQSMMRPNPRVVLTNPRQPTPGASGCREQTKEHSSCAVCGWGAPPPCHPI